MLIINGKVFTMENDIVYENGYVRMIDGKIADVGDMDDLKSEDAESDILNVGGAWVMPGLIDAHCHVGICEEKWGAVGDDCNEGVKPVTPHLRALDAVNPMDPAFHDAIIAGITSLMTGPGSANIVGGKSLVLKTQGRNIERMVLREPAAMKVAFGENPKTNFGNQNMMPCTRMAIAGMLREELYEACEYYEKKKSGNLEKPDFRKESWIPVLEKEIPLKAHVHRADDILTAIRIAKEFDVHMTLDHCTEGHLIADEIAESGFPAIVGPDLTSRTKLEIKNMSFKTAGVLARAGVKIAIMSDHPVSIIRYLPIYAGLTVNQGLRMSDAWKAITIHAAEICGTDDQVGSLVPGKDGDVAIFTGNPMEIFSKTLYTIIDGEIVYRLDE